MEQDCYEDIQGCYEWLTKTKQVPPNRIILYCFASFQHSKAVCVQAQVQAQAQMQTLSATYGLTNSLSPLLYPCHSISVAYSSAHSFGRSLGSGPTTHLASKLCESYQKVLKKHSSFSSTRKSREKEESEPVQPPLAGVVLQVCPPLENSCSFTHFFFFPP